MGSGDSGLGSGGGYWASQRAVQMLLPSPRAAARLPVKAGKGSFEFLVQVQGACFRPGCYC